MNIRLTKPLPQPSLGRVIPAGVVIDAPAGLSERLMKQGYAEYPEAQTGSQRQADAAETQPKQQRRRNGGVKA